MTNEFFYSCHCAYKDSCERLSEEQQRAVLDVLSLNRAVGVVVCDNDKDFTIRAACGFFLEMLGHTAESLKAASGGSFLRLVDPRDRSIFLDENNSAARRTYRLLHRTGQTVQVTEYHLQAPDVAGRPTRVISVRASGVVYAPPSDVDVTEFDFDKAEAQSKEEFFFQRSHDIRTPLNSILGMTAIALEQCNDPVRVRESLGKIADAGRILTTLLTGILSLNQMEVGDVEEKPPVNLKDFLESTTQLIAVQADTRRQTVRLVADGIRHENVKVPAVKLQCILSNFLDNAVKYTPAGGVITMTVTERDSESANTAVYDFTVEDNGVGMSEDFLDKLFVPFERSPEVISKHIDGSGIGLAVTADLVRRLGGSIKAQSKLGEGTRMVCTLEFPLVDPTDLLQFSVAATSALPGSDVAVKLAEVEMTVPGVPETRIPLAPGETPVVLVVDDNELNCEIAEEFVRMAGGEPVSAASGEEAVHCFISSPVNRFHLILMDIQMPGMSGYRAARAIRASGRADAGIPIVAVSALALGDVAMAVKAAGMNDYLSKPIVQPQLAALLAKYCTAS